METEAIKKIDSLTKGRIFTVDKLLEYKRRSEQILRLAIIDEMKADPNDPLQLLDIFKLLQSQNTSEKQILNKIQIDMKNQLVKTLKKDEVSE
jgi:hypothetical protein